MPFQVPIKNDTISGTVELAPGSSVNVGNTVPVTGPAGAAVSVAGNVGVTGNVGLVAGTAVNVGNTVPVTGPAGAAVSVAGNVNIGNAVSIVDGASVNVGNAVSLAAGSAINVVNAVDLAAGASVNVGNTVNNPVGVKQPQNGEDYYYWPCVSGEGFPPVLSSASYSRDLGLGIITFTAGSARATWKAYAIVGPLGSAAPVMVMRGQVKRPPTGDAGRYIRFGFVPESWALGQQGRAYITLRDNGVTLPGNAAEGAVQAYPAGCPAPDQYVPLEIRLNFATNQVVYKVNGTVMAGISYAGSTDNLYFFCFSTHAVHGVTQVRGEWSDVL